jgi:putative effector of murein hydrolase LrgA (UPF0299 family)
MMILMFLLLYCSVAFPEHNDFRQSLDDIFKGLLLFTIPVCICF